VQDDAIPLQLPTVEVLLQPIVSLDTHHVRAAEALSRLSNGVPVLQALADADARGTTDRLEAYLLRQALAARHRVPAGALLCLNLSADALVGRASAAVLDALPTLQGLVLELRQEAAWEARPELLARVDRLRGRGALLALDDAARGFRGLLAIAQLKPDWVKVDRSVVTGSLHDPVRRAGLDMFAQSAERSGSLLVAEGVETEDDLVALAKVGVTLAQGYLFSPAVSGVLPPALVPGTTTGRSAT
jgi:EAL domain-containing protein (putative c-di-GMP-specific phosphodiesterase class I)